jgi:hypothetical protein
MKKQSRTQSAVDRSPNSPSNVRVLAAMLTVGLCTARCADSTMATDSCSSDFEGLRFANTCSCSPALSDARPMSHGAFPDLGAQCVACTKPYEVRNRVLASARFSTSVARVLRCLCRRKATVLPRSWTAVTLSASAASRSARVTLFWPMCALQPFVIRSRQGRAVSLRLQAAGHQACRCCYCHRASRAKARPRLAGLLV